MRISKENFKPFEIPQIYKKNYEKITNSTKNKIEILKELINNSKNAIMFFDTDTDGSNSYIMLKKEFPQIKKGYPLSKEEDLQKEACKKITEKVDLILFFDTPRLIEDFFENSNNKNIIWVDHHVPRNQNLLEKYKNITFLNPLDFDKKDHRCSAYWAWKISGEKKEDLFYLVMAFISDFYLLPEIIDLYNFSINDFNLLFPKLDENKRNQIFDFIINSDFRDDEPSNKKEEYIKYLTYETSIIDFKYFFDLIFKIEKENAIKTIKFVLKLTPIEFKLEIENPKSIYFEEYYKIVLELRKIIKKIDKIQENDFIYFHHKNGSFSFNRQISEYLSYKRKATLIMSSYQKDTSNYISCSLRSKKIDLNNLIDKSIKNLEGQGGGHKFAAGCIISKKDFPVFLKNIKNFSLSN
jgi:single-stranded DNA-specific DHH superfamily exonuclease